VKGCNLTIRRSFTTGYPRPDLAALGYASGDERYSIGSRLNLYASRVNLSTTISTRIDIFISSAYASIFSYNNSGTGCYAFVQNGGDLTDCLFDRTNIEFLDYYSNFSGCKSHLGQNAIVFYSGFSSYSRRDIVRNFSPIGAEADYYIEARNALTFINSPDVNLLKAKSMITASYLFKPKLLRLLSISIN
jgi:hypothetical protein